MKRSAIVSFIFLVSLGLVSAQSISVQSPKPNDLYFTGGKIKIIWTNSGCTSSNVKVNIFHDSISTANFVEQLTGQNSGNLEWKIPSDLAEGNYILRVKTDPAEDGCVGDSGLFVIEVKETNTAPFQETIVGTVSHKTTRP